MQRRILRIVIIVEGILILGFLPTLFNPNARIYGGAGGGWDWSPWVFVSPLAGLMVLTGLAIDAAARKIKNPMLRIIVIIALASAFATVWVRIVQSD